MKNFALLLFACIGATKKYDGFIENGWKTQKTGHD